MWCGGRIHIPAAATTADLGRKASCTDPASSAAPVPTSAPGGWGRGSARPQVLQGGRWWQIRPGHLEEMRRTGETRNGHPCCRSRRRRRWWRIRLGKARIEGASDVGEGRRAEGMGLGEEVEADEAKRLSRRAACGGEGMRMRASGARVWAGFILWKRDLSHRNEDGRSQSFGPFGLNREFFHFLFN
jgi:hypothetical protein